MATIDFCFAKFTLIKSKFQITNSACCGEVIDKLLTEKLSCIAVVNEHNMVIGKISKNDIMRELVEQSNNYLEIVNVPIKVIHNLFKYLDAEI